VVAAVKIYKVVVLYGLEKKKHIRILWFGHE